MVPGITIHNYFQCYYVRNCCESNLAIMLSSVDERNRGKQMGYVYFSWLLGLLVGMVIMNLLIKFHPTRFAFLMALVVLIAWVLYYFVNINLTNYNTKPVKAQLKANCRCYTTSSYSVLSLCYFLSKIITSSYSISGYLVTRSSYSNTCTYSSKYATQVVKVSTVEYTVAIIIGGIGCAFSMLFYQKSSTIIMGFMYVIFSGFILYTILIFGLSTITNIYIVWAIGLYWANVRYPLTGLEYLYGWACNLTNRKKHGACSTVFKASVQ